MSRTFVQPGNSLTLTAPSGGVTASVPLLIGALLIVPHNTAAQGEPFEGERVGVHTLPKATSQAWTEGAKLYWDNTAKNITTTASGNTLVGVASAAAGSSDTTGVVLLDGVVR